MLGATTAGALADHVSVPPLPHELSEQAKRDWLTGVELVNTCMATHDTQTYVTPPDFVCRCCICLFNCRFCSELSAEIVHFRTPGDNVNDWSGRTDWYIKGSR